MKEEMFFRNFGSLSGDSCVTDIYKKRIKANQKRRWNNAKKRKNRPVPKKTR